MIVSELAISSGLDCSLDHVSIVWSASVVNSNIETPDKSETQGERGASAPWFFAKNQGLHSPRSPAGITSADGNDTWHESPFWIWTVAAPRRRQLFVRRVGDELQLTDRGSIDPVGVMF